jgi:hypothetical protein
VLKRIFGPKGNEGTENWGKWCEELHDLYSSLNTMLLN